MYPQVYSNLLLRRLTETKCPVYLLNTGWYGGAYGEGGQRFPIPATRSLVHAIYSGEAAKAPKEIMPYFNLQVPTKIKGVSSDILMPYKAGLENATYMQHLKTLVSKFQENFGQYDVSEEIINAGPSGTTL